jgi:hypothetical protein
MSFLPVSICSRAPQLKLYYCDKIQFIIHPQGEVLARGAESTNILLSGKCISPYCCNASLLVLFLFCTAYLSLHGLYEFVSRAQ